MIDKSVLTDDTIIFCNWFVHNIIKNEINNLNLRYRKYKINENKKYTYCSVNSVMVEKSYLSMQFQSTIRETVLYYVIIYL